MLATLGIECIGWGRRGLPRPPACDCIAYRRSATGHTRAVLRPKVDYARVTGSGSRGVWLWYVLEPDALYEVHAPLSWSRVDHYFCAVAGDGALLRFVTLEEGLRWWQVHQPPLTSDRLALTS